MKKKKKVLQTAYYTSILPDPVIIYWISTFRFHSAHSLFAG